MRMSEITIDNCYKCNLETIVDPNNSQYFWINRRNLEIESKRNWQVIFDKHKDSLRQKYRKELTPNIKFLHNKIFARNYLFEEIIKNCKTTNLEFLKLKEKLGLCLYEVICDEQESEEIFTQHDVENEQLRKENEQSKKENEQLRKENEQLRKENEQLKKQNEQLRKNNVTKDATIKESIKKPIEIKSLKKDVNTTDYPNWLDKNKFEKMLATIDSNKFNHKNKIGEFKYNDIKDLVNNIKSDTISEIDAKKDLNTLNKIQNAETIKYKRHTSTQKELLNLFNDLLDTILTDKILMSSKDDINENENENDNIKKI